MNPSELSPSVYVLLTLALSSLLVTQFYLLQAPTVRELSAIKVQQTRERYMNSKNLSTNINSNGSNHSTFAGRDCKLPVEKRFDCARDRTLSQTQCEERGCCYMPLPQSEYIGPPWCFYPMTYPGYRMGPLSPTPRGQSATLTRDTPSYLPRDIPTLQLEVMEEDAGCLHLTVSSCI